MCEERYSVGGSGRQGPASAILISSNWRTLAWKLRHHQLLSRSLLWTPYIIIIFILHVGHFNFPPYFVLSPIWCLTPHLATGWDFREVVAELQLNDTRLHCYRLLTQLNKNEWVESVQVRVYYPKSLMIRLFVLLLLLQLFNNGDESSAFSMATSGKTSLHLNTPIPLATDWNNKAKPAMAVVSGKE